jgi:ribosomal protein L16 Arg81 hydroxylase
MTFKPEWVCFRQPSLPTTSSFSFLLNCNNNNGLYLLLSSIATTTTTQQEALYLLLSSIATTTTQQEALYLLLSSIATTTTTQQEALPSFFLNCNNNDNPTRSSTFFMNCNNNNNPTRSSTFFFMNCNNNPTRRSSTRLCKKYDKVWSSSWASFREHHWIKKKKLGKSGNQSREKPLVSRAAIIIVAQGSQAVSV